MPVRSAKPSPWNDFVSSSMVIKIIIVTIAVYILDNLMLRNVLTSFLGLDHGLFTKHFHVWELFTYALAHSPMSQPRGVWHVVFNMYALWLFGRSVENRYGSTEFLVFYIVTAVLSALTWVVCQMALGQTAVGLIGASGAVSAVVILFAVTFPQQKLQLIFPPIILPAWVLGVVIVLLDLRGAVGQSGDDIAFAVHLAGAALALLYYYTGFSFTRGAPRAKKTTRVKKERALLHQQRTVPRHTCLVCGVTNLADPKMEFRYCSKCDGAPCYCETHLQDHEHVTAEQQQPS